MQAGPSGLGLLLLPSLARSNRVLTDDAAGAEARALQLGFEMLRRVRIDPGADLLAEGCFFGCVLKIHCVFLPQAAASTLPALMRSISRLSQVDRDPMASASAFERR